MVCHPLFRRVIAARQPYIKNLTVRRSVSDQGLRGSITRSAWPGRPWRWSAMHGHGRSWQLAVAGNWQWLVLLSSANGKRVSANGNCHRQRPMESANDTLHCQRQLPLAIANGKRQATRAPTRVLILIVTKGWGHRMIWRWAVLPRLRGRP